MTIRLPFDRQDLVDLVTEYMVDDMYYAIIEEDAMVYDTLMEIGTRGWQPYRSRDVRDTVFVKNVKGRGMPDWEDVFELVASKEGMEYDEVRDNMSDEQLYNLWEDEARFAIEDQDVVDDKEFVVVGRMGGYWGVTSDAIDIYPDSQKVMAYVEMNIDKYIEDNYTQEEVDNIGELEKDDFAIALTDYMLDDLSDEELIDVSGIDLTLESKEKIQELDRWIEGVIEMFEDPEYWADLIIMNGLHLD